MVIIFYSISGIIALLNYAYHWIDDKELQASIFSKFICKLTGCTPSHRSIDNDDLFGAHMIITTFIIPASIALFFWQIAIWGVLAFGIAFTIRSGRRLQKKLVAHIADLTMHKKQKATKDE